MPAKKGLDISKIGIRFEPHDFVAEVPANTRVFKIWLYWKNQDYPFCYIGTLSSVIAENLGISEKEAKVLILKLLEESLPLAIENEDKELAEYIEWRIREFKPRAPIPKRMCRNKGCNTVFQPKNIAHVYCEKCHDAYYGKKPQARDLLEDEKKLLESIRKVQEARQR